MTEQDDTADFEPKPDKVIDPKSGEETTAADADEQDQDDEDEQ